MKKLICCFLAFLLGWFSSLSLAQESTDKLPSAVDISRISGLNRLLATIYNQQRWLYGLVGFVLAGIIALILSFLTDWIMGKLGYKAERMEHKE